MSPKKSNSAPNNIYTAMLAVATIVVLATAVFVAYKCIADYGTLGKVIEAAR